MSYLYVFLLEMQLNLMFPFIFTLLILLDQASKYFFEHFL